MAAERQTTVVVGDQQSMERTFIAVKPDGVQRGLIGQIVKRFEQRGYKLVAAKLCKPGKPCLEQHYAELKDKPFFPALVAYMTSGPVFAMIWEGKEVVNMGRSMLGKTDPLASDPGTVRGDYGIDKGRNVCHGSDSVKSAEREISLWFTPDELMYYGASQAPWIYE